MKALSLNTNKWVIAGAVVIGLAAVLGVEPAMAQGGSDLATYSDGHATEQLGGFARLMITFALVAGILITLVSLMAMAALAMDKAPQQLQQVGWKGPIITLIIGGVLTSIMWLVSSSAQTATGGDMDTETWQRLQGSAVEYRIEKVV